VENGVAHLHNVAITTDYGTEIEVHHGIKDGGQVILQPAVNHTNGDKVRIVPEPAAVTVALESAGKPPAALQRYGSGGRIECGESSSA